MQLIMKRSGTSAQCQLEARRLEAQAAAADWKRFLRFTNESLRLDMPSLKPIQVPSPFLRRKPLTSMKYPPLSGVSCGTGAGGIAGGGNGGT
mmetsp:Transcript_56763/g.135213  ORF Transcript_56763/g.135213 Transcript_56763/m.135213 type:complete len:92 (-) Transcript_56763:1343-1618(-)